MTFWGNLTGKSTKNDRFGLSENDRYFCLIQLHKNEITVDWLNKPCDLNEVTAALTPDTIIIRPVPFHYIWRKYLFLPIDYSEQAIYRQIVRVLRQELPVPLEEVYFDYVAHPLIKEGVVRIVLHALRRSCADPLSVTKNTVLDCEIYCFARGFDYLRAGKNDEKPSDTYLVNDKSFRFTLDALEINDITENQRKNFSRLDLSDHILDPYLYITALGACLWNGKVSI